MNSLIIINEKNVERIRKKLNEGQKRCTARLVEPEQVFEAVDCIEKHRERYGILKKNMEEVSVRVNWYNEQYAKTYKYNSRATVFEIYFRRGTYCLGHVYRGYCSRSGETHFEFKLTYNAKKDVLKRADTF